MTSDEKEQLGADLSAYLDGELEPMRLAEIERLLETSDEARALLERIGGVSRELRELPRMRAPTNLAVSVTHAAATNDGKRNRMHRMWIFSRAAAAAAAIVLCFYTGWETHKHVATMRGADDPASTSRRLTSETPLAAARSKSDLEVYKPKGDDTFSPIAQKHAAPHAEALTALRSLGDVGGYEEAETSSEPAPVLALRTPIELEAGPEADGVVVRELTQAPALTINTTTPMIEIVVAPQNAEQFESTLSAVAVLCDAVETRRADGGGRGGGRVSRAAEEYAATLPAEEVYDLLRELEERAPRQVSIGLQFKSFDLACVQQIIAPNDINDESAPITVAAADAPEEPDADKLLAYRTRDRQAGRGSSRSSGRVARSTESVLTETAHNAAMREQPSPPPPDDRQPAVEEVARPASEISQDAADQTAIGKDSCPKVADERPAAMPEVAPPGAEIILKIKILPPPEKPPTNAGDD